MITKVEEIWVDGVSELFIPIPEEILDKLEWEEKDVLELELTENGLVITKKDDLPNNDECGWDPTLGPTC